MKIAILGTGYVGLVSGTCFSEFGFHVTCFDVQADKIDLLNRGEMPIYEPGLDVMVQKNAAQGRLQFTTDLAKAVQDADVVFIAVGTPPNPTTGEADLTYVFQAVESLEPFLTSYKVIITKSTVPVGTTRRLQEHLRTRNPSAQFDMVSNPEFLREGAAIEDFMRPNRVIIGCESAQAREVMQQLYRPLYLLETPAVYTNFESSELIKYASNAFLATKITFINEMADLCEACGAEVKDVAKGMGLDMRIGKKFLNVSPGYGGSCFPKDTLALAETAKAYGAPTHIVETVIARNDARKIHMAERIRKIMENDLSGKTIAVLGVTFKPQTDDIRESPALTIIPALQNYGARIQAFDPQGMKAAAAILGGVTWTDSPYAAMEDADALVILTEWNEFRALDLRKVHTLLKTPLIIDWRNIYTPAEMSKRHFNYYSLGRAPVLQSTDAATQKQAFHGS